MRAPVNEPVRIDRDARTADPLFDPMYHANRVIVGFMQGLFRSLPAGGYTWSPDPEQTEITITDAAPITAQALTQRPCIVTVRGQVSYVNNAMNSFEGMDPYTGRRAFRDLLSSSFAINCMSKNGVEAARLAWFVASHIKALRHMIQRSGPFALIGQDVTVMGEMQPGGLVQDPADSGAVNVPVIVPFIVQHRWEVQEPSLKAGGIRVIMNDTDYGLVEEE
jgi:hypothetical protein